MSDVPFQGEFIEEAQKKVLEHLSNEAFGVSELAGLMNMSRSNLLRKIKKQTQLSASQFIRQIRLQKGMELLTDTELTVSEIAYQVGFGNNSYFIKCFREHYGYSPGESRKRSLIEEVHDVKTETDGSKQHQKEEKKGRNTLLIILVTGLILLLAAIFILKNPFASSAEVEQEEEKSIAVLPFKNMSSDSSNLYFVNGLMESALNNLQKIEDLRVISRTSVEKYRYSTKTISEIAKELNVTYLVEGSGQRIDDQILLNIQLIKASTETPIWAEQYKDEIVDVFSLQNAVAKKITDAIEVKVTANELELIEKQPTENLEAYDYYLQALTPFQAGTKEGLEEAIPLFEKAIEYDSEFALAYSNLAIAYYYLDIYKAEKQYTDIINNYADKALLYDSKSAESLISKALYYMNNEEYRYAIPHLEKALEYNPNSSAVVQMLSAIYSNVLPNTEKFLQNALKGIQLDIAANDSTQKSFIYLNLSNAFIQTGFVEEALKYIDLAVKLNPENYYAPYLKIFIDYAHHLDLSKINRQLSGELKKDTTRLDIMQEVAKFHYFNQEYDSAFYYYEKFTSIKEKEGLGIYPQENLKMGIVYEKMGFLDKANTFYQAYTDYCEMDDSIYKSASLAVKYVHEGKYDLAIEQFDKFSQQNNFQYWMILFLDKDPLLQNFKKHPKYEAVVEKIENRFWENHNQLRKSLEDQKLL